MTKEERDASKRMTEAMQLLGEPERRYLIGYAEGVIAANSKAREAGKRADKAAEAV